MILDDSRWFSMILDDDSDDSDDSDDTDASARSFWNIQEWMEEKQEASVRLG